MSDRYGGYDAIRGYVDEAGIFIHAPLAGQPCPHCKSGRVGNVFRHQGDPQWYPWCPVCRKRADDPLAPPPADAEALREALESIAANTCCDGCREAAKVARAALLSRPRAGDGELKANLISNRKLGQLLELIDKLCRIGNGQFDGNSIGNVIAQKARAILLQAEPAPAPSAEEVWELLPDLIDEAEECATYAETHRAGLPRYDAQNKARRELIAKARALLPRPDAGKGE